MDKKNTLLLTVIAVATLLVAIVGATFAYFTAQTGAGQQVDINVTTSTSDASMFGKSTDGLSLTVNQANFGESAGTATNSLIDTTYAWVSLTANNNTKKGDVCYKVGVAIEVNNLIYSLPKTRGENTGDYYPELLLRIWKGSESEKALVDDGEWSGTYNEYGATGTYSFADTLPTAKTGSTYNDIENATADTVTVPYISSSDGLTLATKKLCTDDVIFGDGDNSLTKCKNEQVISGYDITMLGYTGDEGDKFADVKQKDKKLILIPSTSGEYIHKVTVDKASAGSPSPADLTSNDYWKLDLIFVNYSDSDINTTPNEALTQWSTAHNNSTSYADQNDNTKKTVTAKFALQPVACPGA